MPLIPTFAGGPAVGESQFNFTDRFYESAGVLNAPWVPEPSGGNQWSRTGAGSATGTAVSGVSGVYNFVKSNAPGNLCAVDYLTAVGAAGFIGVEIMRSIANFEAYILLGTIGSANTINHYTVNRQNGAGGQTVITSGAITVTLPARFILAYNPITDKLWWDIFGLPAAVAHPFYPSQGPFISGGAPTAGDNRLNGPIVNSQSSPTVTMNQVFAHAYVGNP